MGTAQTLNIAFALFVIGAGGCTGLFAGKPRSNGIFAALVGANLFARRFICFCRTSASPTSRRSSNSTQPSELMKLRGTGFIRGEADTFAVFSSSEMPHSRINPVPRAPHQRWHLRPLRQPIALTYTCNSEGVCVLSQSASAAFVRVCHPGAEALNCSSTSGARRMVIRSRTASALGRPRLTTRSPLYSSARSKKRPSVQAHRPGQPSWCR